MNLRLDPCNYTAAKYAVNRWHYSKQIPSGRNNYFGVWEDEKFIGVVVYGHSIGVHLAESFGLTNFTCVELRRVALMEHKMPVSRIISISLKLLKKKNPKIRLVVSYADPLQNHIGGIYQAGNWLYVGQSAAMKQFCINGRWRNDRNAYSDKKHLAADNRVVPAKHKYLYPIDDEMKKRIERLRKPYPKLCGRSDTGTRPGSTRKRAVRVRPDRSIQEK